MAAAKLISPTKTHSIRSQTSMSKHEMIDRIMQLNRSARREFLQSFTENELADYLHQIEGAGPIRPEPYEETAALAVSAF
jgi:hypothetical protein